MLSHLHIWAGIDALAQRRSLSASGLARLAGLDPTTFNRSKRFGPDGKPRWPSTESIAKVLEATGASFPEFAALAAGAPQDVRSIPLLGFAQAAEPGCFDSSGLPKGAGWDAICFPTEADKAAYALEITGDDWEPVYRRGDRIVIAPGVEVRPGDRVVALVEGCLLAKQLGRVTARRIELAPLNPGRAVRLVDVHEVAWIARVIWASQ